MAVENINVLEHASDELLELVLQQTMQTTRFKTALKPLLETLRSIKPVFCDSRRLSKVLDRPEKEITIFIKYMEKEKEHIDMEERTMSSTRMRSLIGIYDLANKLDQMLSAIDTTHDHHMHKYSSSCTVPRLLAEVIVGLDLHLQKLKCRLFNGDTQVS
ncbi:probable disease resistance protein [Tanacetum coccineum]|uniref:Probable disease resistance protein n=1 Tax=Tanacetum coccineum TaxID=301880 RepID=A0ABQ5FRX0_9ASTR